MEFNFVINPKIETICEQKAKEVYTLEKQISEQLGKEINVEHIIDEVKREIYHQMLIGKPKDVKMSEFANSKSEVKKAWFALRNKYAEEAVRNVIESDKTEFINEAKEELIDQVNTIKKMLDTLSNEIRAIKKGQDLEFITPIITMGSIQDNINCLKKDIEDWKEEGTVYQNVFGE